MESRPYYTIDERKIRKNITRLRIAYAGQEMIFSYSVKTNHTPHIVRAFFDAGFMIEVVSDMEYDLAKAVGVPDEYIIYNGPIKGPKAKLAMERGAIICFDSFADFRQLNPVKGKCMFRVAVDVGNGVDTRFGSTPDEVVNNILYAKARGIDVVGIHCHVTHGRDLKWWKRRLEIMSDLYKRVRYGLSMKLVDFGGNMYSPLKPSEDFRSPATYEEYARLFQEFRPMLHGATTVLEMGTSVVANVMDFTTTVLGIKKTEKNTFVILDAGKYMIGWASEEHNYPIEVKFSEDSDSMISEYVENATFVGRYCTEDDILYRGFSGWIGVGDAVTFKDVGAYTIDIKPPFILPDAEAYFIDRYGNEKKIRREGNAEDILSPYCDVEIWKK